MSDLYYRFSKFILPVFLVFGITTFLAGQRTISGTITDANTKEGIIGANIAVVGSTIGTVSDYDGSYTLVVPEGFNRIAISYTGYNTVEIDLANTSVFDVALGEGLILDEVVTIGYGTVKRKDVTGALQTVSSRDFNKGAITGPQDLIAGKIAGVVVTNEGSPGSGANIRIRGESSLQATRDPLIVVDGVPLDNSPSPQGNGGISGGRNPLNVINPNDIETFTVLKDASAAAIYGNRASAGVILITTKKGSATGKLKLGYSGYVSSGVPINHVDALESDEYRALIYQQFDSTHEARTLLGNANTNWQDEIYQTAFGMDHNLYATGAVAKIPFRVSLGYTDQEGILKTDEFNRITAGVNLSPGFINNTLQLNLNFKSMFTDNHFGNRSAIGNALNFDPTQAIYDTLSPYGGYTTWTISNVPNNLAPTNPIALLDLRDDNSNENRYLTNFTVDYRLPFLPALRANLNLGYDYYRGEGTVVVPTYASFAFDAINGGGTNNEYNQTKKNSILEFYLNYKTALNKNTFDIMGGYSWQHFDIDNYFRNSDAAGTPAETTSGSDPAELYLISFYGRVNYDYNDRLLATFTLRQDGTSRFAPENRWGLFPAAALAYKVFDNDKNAFNSLKVRLGWGITGQQDIGNDYYAYLAKYQLGNESASYIFGEDTITTLRPNGYDSQIKWEETKTYNIGADFSIIRDVLSGSLDVYKRYTKDLLNRIPVPAGTNLSNFVTTNVGDMDNQGVELALFATPISNSKLRWEVAFNAAYNHNEITKLTATDDPSYQGVLTGGIAGGVGSNIQIHTVGYAPRSFFVYKQLYDESGNILENQFEDLNNDGVINGEDKYRYKNPSPDVTLGFSSRLDIGNFDFSFSGRANLGNYVYNNVQTDMGYLSRLYGSSGTLWNVNQSAIDNNVVNQASLTFSDHFVTKADFMKIDHITAGYTFHNLIGSFLRIYASAQSPVTVTSYEGLDPEIFSGIDNSIYPRARTFVFGLNVEF